MPTRRFLTVPLPGRVASPPPPGFWPCRRARSGRHGGCHRVVVTVTGQRRALPRPATWRTVAALAALTGVAVLPYLAGVLVPYHVNDLDQLSLAEVASGRH